MTSKPCPECNAVIKTCECGEWDCAFYAHLGKDCLTPRGLEYQNDKRVRMAEHLIGQMKQETDPAKRTLGYAVARLGEKGMSREQAKAALDEAFERNRLLRGGE